MRLAIDPISGMPQLIPQVTETTIVNHSGGVSAPSNTGSGSAVLSVTSKSSDYTATASDDVILVSGNTTITLPSAVGATKAYTVKKLDPQGTTTTIATTAGQTIDGGASATILVRYSSITVVSDGANWNVI